MLKILVILCIPYKAPNNGQKRLNIHHVDSISLLGHTTITSMSTIQVITLMQVYAKLITHLSLLLIGAPIRNTFDLIVELMSFYSLLLEIGSKIKVNIFLTNQP